MKSGEKRRAVCFSSGYYQKAVISSSKNKASPWLFMSQRLAEGGRRPTLPLYAVPSAPKGLTSVFGMGTGGSPSLQPPKCLTRCDKGQSSHNPMCGFYVSLRAISTARLWHRCLYTCGLSTSQSPTALEGNLILEQASRLDAFSAYPSRTQLPCGAAGATTGTPEVRPPRSSRTNGSIPQISSAHNRQGPNCLTTF